MHDMIQNSQRLRRPRRNARQGFTLIEATLALLLLSLIFAGVMDLFLTTAKVTNRTNALASASLSGANAVQQVLKDTREAESLSLPGDPGPGNTGFQPLANYTDINTYYKTTVSGNIYPIFTALQINRPNTQAPSFFDSSGTSKTPSTVYDRTTLGNSYLLYYRGDINQTPNPSTGQYLWKYDSATSTTTVVCRTIATAAADAVQFVKPLGINTQVAVKIVSGQYSLINGQQTSEETNGSTTSALTGKCALMRDYGEGNVPSSNQAPCNHAFQKS